MYNETVFNTIDLYHPTSKVIPGKILYFDRNIKWKCKKANNNEETCTRCCSCALHYYKIYNPKLVHYRRYT